MQAHPRFSSPRFIGREPELTRLRAMLEAACAGSGSVALLAGELGIGKTRMAEELAVHAGLRDIRVLWGRCYEGDGAPPFWPWVQVIRAAVRGQEPDALLAELGSAAADIAALVPAVRERLPGLPVAPSVEPAQARFRLFDSITAFLTGAAARQPLVLILDDLHWADAPSLLLLSLVARELRSARLLVVGTCREGEGGQHALAEILADLAREPVAVYFRLRGLGEPQVARFIEAVAGWHPSAPLVAAVYQQTEGNPFFVTELVRLLAAEGQPMSAPGGALPLAIPPTVRAAIGRRLGPRAGDLLRQHHDGQRHRAEHHRTGRHDPQPEPPGAHRGRRPAPPDRRLGPGRRAFRRPRQRDHGRSPDEQARNQGERVDQEQSGYRARTEPELVPVDDEHRRELVGPPADREHRECDLAPGARAPSGTSHGRRTLRSYSA